MRILKKYYVGAILFLFGILIGGGSMFYIQKAKYQRRISLMSAEASFFITLPLCNLRSNSKGLAIEVLENYLNMSLLAALNGDKNVLMERESMALLLVADYRKKYNCQVKDKCQEQEIANFFSKLKEYLGRNPPQMRIFHPSARTASGSLQHPPN